MDQEYTRPDEQQDLPEEQREPLTSFADTPCEDSFVPIEPSRKKERKIGKRLISAALVLALLILACGATSVGVSIYWNNRMRMFEKVLDNKFAVLQEQLNESSGSAAAPNPQQKPTDALQPGQVYAQNVNAVVAISNQTLKTNIFGQVSETASSGSGFIISSDGYVVTNYHVAEGASKLSVIMYDSKEYDAKMVGYDASNDLAVLKIEAKDLPYVKIGSSDDLVVGDQVMAIGNPLGELTSTLTVGYVSAKDRAVNTEGRYMNMLQTDAAINSGNSGGPLFNSYGEVVGITTAKYSGTSSSGATIEGVGFAIPIDDVVDMIDDLVKHGFVTGAYLGVMVRDMDASVAQTYGLPTGVYVDSVTNGSCAEKAGVKAKDIIINLGGYDVTSMSELTRALRKLEAGQATTITVYRSGTQVHLDITLDEKPQPTVQEEVQQPTQTPSSGNFEDWFGSFFPDFG